MGNDEPAKRSGTERQYVDALASFSQPLAIARQHFEVSQTPVGKEYRLRALQMCVTGQHGLAVVLRQIEQGASWVDDQLFGELDQSLLVTTGASQ